MPTCWIIAGPNGAGKTTFALKFLPTLPDCDRFLNADLIAAGLDPLHPGKEMLAAGRIFLGELDKTVARKKSFAFETTLSGKTYLRTLKKMKADGWDLHLIYLAVENAKASSLRVAERVIKGGHNVPSKDLERRFPRSLANLFGDYSKIVDLTECFWSEKNFHVPVFTIENGKLTVFDSILYDHLYNLSKP